MASLPPDSSPHLAILRTSPTALLTERSSEAPSQTGGSSYRAGLYSLAWRLAIVERNTMYKKSPCETITVQREFTLQNGGPVDDKWSYARYKHLCIKYTLYCKSSKNQVNYFKIVKNHVKSRDSQVHLDRGQVVFPGTPRAGNFHDLPQGLTHWSESRHRVRQAHRCTRRVRYSW